MTNSLNQSLKGDTAAQVFRNKTADIMVPGLIM